MGRAIPPSRQRRASHAVAKHPAALLLFLLLWCHAPTTRAHFLLCSGQNLAASHCRCHQLLSSGRGFRARTMMIAPFLLPSSVVLHCCCRQYCSSILGRAASTPTSILPNPAPGILMPSHVPSRSSFLYRRIGPIPQPSAGSANHIQNGVEFQNRWWCCALGRVQTVLHSRVRSSEILLFFSCLLRGDGGCSFNLCMSCSPL